MELVVLACVCYAEALCKAVAEVVRGTALQSNAVVHHRLTCIGFFCACKFFLFGLSADYRRNCKRFSVEALVNVEHTQCFFSCLFLCFVHCVTFLPQELGSTQERTCCLFPSNNTAPLIVKLGQITVCIDYLLVMLAEKRFGSRANAKTLGKLFLSSDCYPRTFGSKSLNVVFFLLKQAFGDKHWHIDILVTCFLKSAVKVSLYIFPDCIAVRSDYHTSLDV